MFASYRRHACRCRGAPACAASLMTLQTRSCCLYDTASPYSGWTALCRFTLLCLKAPMYPGPAQGKFWDEVLEVPCKQAWRPRSCCSGWVYPLPLAEDGLDDGAPTLTQVLASALSLCVSITLPPHLCFEFALCLARLM
uniref:Uncharacterized protein n=1 Tax=Triticum urartu TaxID=4572 RepID=A0A8R7PNT9_TRIUA